MKIESLKNKKIAIIVGGGDLPLEVVKSAKALGLDFSIIRFSEVPSNVLHDGNIIEATFEQISKLFTELKSRNFNTVAFCGYMKRPKLNFEKVDIESQLILEPVIKNFTLGDEAIFSSVLNLFKFRHITPLSVSDLLPKFFPTNEFLTRLKPTKSDMLDAKRSEEILAVTSSVDLGQSLVVGNGICIAIETAPGTDAMLAFVRTLKNNNGGLPEGGVFYKAPKKGQNLYIDQPVIGLRTIEAVKHAGLNGIVIKHSKVIFLDPEKIIELADKLGIFIWSKK